MLWRLQAEFERQYREKLLAEQFQEQVTQFQQMLWFHFRG